MIKTFVLIIWFGGHGIATQEFSSLDKCKAAGMAFDGESAGSRYLCVEK